MAPKRKAPAASGRASKRVASGVSTPVSIDSDDDFSGSEGNESTGPNSAAPPKYDKVINSYKPSAYVRKKGKQPQDAADRLFRADRDFADQQLKSDHHLRPLWLDPVHGKVVLETFSPSFKQAQNFLINVAEPQSRTTNMHEYTITAHSLFAAVSVGLTEQDIVRQLELFSKTKLPDSIIEYVHKVTQSFGKVRLVLFIVRRSLR